MYSNYMRNSLLELFFPRFCIGCGYLGSYICDSCEKRLEKVKKITCFYCGKSSLFGLTHPGCKHKDGIDGYLSMYLYTGLFKKILHESKYKGSFAVLETLLSLSGQCRYEEVEIWKRLFNPCITPVPLNSERLRQRGFNQSEMIMEKYSAINDLEKIYCLSRINNTPHLAHIKDKAIRRKIIKGAFTYVGDTVPQTIIVVDDVITSGSTISECAKILKRKGVQTVLTISLAKG